MTTSTERSLDMRTPSLGVRASVLHRKLHKKLDQLRTDGLGAILRKAFHDHIYRASEGVILERFLDTSQSGVGPAIREDVIVVEPKDAMPDLSRHFSASQAAIAATTIRDGCTGFFAVKDGDVIGYGFAARKDFFDAPMRMWCPVKEGEAYTFNWLIAPDQRSFSVAARLEKSCAAYLAAQGCRRSYCWVDSTNLPSLGTLLFLGYQETGELFKMRRLLGWWWRPKRESYPQPRFARYQRRRSARSQPPA